MPPFSTNPTLAADPLAAPMAPAPDFETFFAVSLDLMVIRDAAFRIVKVNQAWERVLGYRADELEGQPMLSFIHPDDVAASRDQMQRVRWEREVRSLVNRYRCRDGSYRVFEWRAHQDGDLVYGVARDVTDRHALEAEMAAARTAAEEANSAKSEFLANMSHEVRTPLNGVIGLAGALARTQLSPDQREMVELIQTSGQTLERVVSDVLDLSKIEAGRLELDIQPFDLRPQLDGLLALYRGQAEGKGLAFRVTYAPGVEGWFQGDAVRIRQVLGNLVSNAIKFTARGAVEVSVDLDPSAGDQLPSVVLAVRDTGIGFDEAFAARLFQRFSQADGSITRRFGGTGLGLAICQALAEMMGGDIVGAARAGQGAEFRVSLPLLRADEVAPPPDASPPAPAQATGSLRVLLAEDHLVNQRVVELILAPMDVALAKVETGDAALEAYMAEDFDLVLMDMQMPVMDGLAATRAIRDFEATRPGPRRTPIIMLSANAMHRHREDAIAAGADLHLAKPITPARLLDAVSRALGTDA